MLHLESVNVIDAWVDVLKQLLEEIPFNEIQKDLTAEIYDLSGVCSHPASKYAAMKIIAVALQVRLLIKMLTKREVERER